MPALKRFGEDTCCATCDTTAVALHPEGIELDTTVFYTRSNGQAGDTDTFVLADGTAVTIAGIVYSPDCQAVLYVPIDSADLILLAPGMIITATIDWGRRHRLMRLYTYPHPLGSLILMPVTDCGTSPDAGRINFDLPESTLDRDTLTTQLSELIGHSTSVRIDLITPEELLVQPELVRTIGMAPPVSTSAIHTTHIDDIGRQPYDGIHVRVTGEIDRMIITKIEKKSRQSRCTVVALVD